MVLLLWWTGKWPLPFTVQPFYNEFICWESSSVSKRFWRKSVAYSKGSSSSSSPLYHVPPSSSILGSACEIQDYLSMRVATGTVFKCFVFSLLHFRGGGWSLIAVAVLLIVAGVFLTSCSEIFCSDILARCSVSGFFPSGLGFPNLWFQPRCNKVRGQSAQLYYSKEGLHEETSILQVVLWWHCQQWHEFYLLQRH